MAEDKKTVPGPAPGKDLTSKIATAYRSMPAEQREKSAPDDADIQNPELDKAFDKMVDMYKVRRPEREKAVVAFPAPPTLRVPKPETESLALYECPECGHVNPHGNQFCGMCGAPREEVSTATANGELDAEEELSGAPTLADKGTKHHHHHYHHHHYRNNPYLLLAVVLLLAVIAWQQWREYRQAAGQPAPTVQAKPQVPSVSHPAQAAPATNPGTQTPPAVKPAPQTAAPATNNQPAKKPVSQLAPPHPAMAPARQGEPPGQAKATESTPDPVAVQVPYQAFPNQAVPTLPSFPAKPTMPSAPPPRPAVSPAVTAGRLISRVPPVYPSSARQAGVEGEVVLQAVIAKDGSVREVRVVSGNPLLAEAAAEAVRQWRYEPSQLNGQPVEAETLVQVNFKK